MYIMHKTCKDTKLYIMIIHKAWEELVHDVKMQCTQVVQNWLMNFTRGLLHKKFWMLHVSSTFSIGYNLMLNSPFLGTLPY
jgi:hypothetical protein